MSKSLRLSSLYAHSKLNPSRPSEDAEVPRAERPRTVSCGRKSSSNLKSTPTAQSAGADINAIGETGSISEMSAKAKLQLPTIMGSTSQGTPKEPQTAYDLQPKASEPEQSDRSNSPATPSITVGNDGQGNDGQVRNQNTWTTRLWPQISGNSQMAVSGAALASSSEPGDPVAMDKPAHDQRMTDSARQDHAEPRGWLSWWQSSQIADRQVVQEDPRSVNAESTNRRPTSPLGAVHKSPADTPSRPASGWALWSHYRGPSLPAQRSTDDQTGKVAVVRRASDPVRETQVSASNLPDSVSQPQSTRTLASNTSTKNEDTDVLPAKAKQSSSVPKAVNLRSSAQLPPNDNLLFPSLDSTFALSADEFGLLRRFNRWIFNVRNTTSSNLIQDRPRINTAVAIGVHGLFPTPMLQTLLGKPTGTSIKFAEMAAEAINKFALHNECSIQNVEKLALEGSGRIEERLEALWKILLSWVDLIRKADLLFVACHSQGVPVAISLVSKLIQFGCCKKGVKIGICAMAGVNLGPFAEFKSRWIGGSAGELFDFARSESRVSKDYRAALDVVLKFGARLTFIGSLDDQLVPLHSSCFSSIRHPNVYRAVWVDGRLHVANFLTGLVGFALKLRNLGTPDHGLIRELSKPLAGSLVGGEGHSVPNMQSLCIIQEHCLHDVQRIYEDPHVYDLALAFALRNAPTYGTELEADAVEFSDVPNPYVLPFALRGLLEEDVVRKELSEEVAQLLRQFDEWSPTTKGLKDVKYRLAGLRTKLVA